MNITGKGLFLFIVGDFKIKVDFPAVSSYRGFYGELYLIYREA